MVKKKRISPQTSRTQSRMASSHLRLTFFSRIMEVLGNTEKYFTGVKNEGYGEPLLYYLPFMIFSALFGAFAFPKYFSEYLTFQVSGILFLFVFVAEIVLQLAVLFFITWLTHFSLRICKGQGQYLDTFKAGVYGSTPLLLWNILSGLFALVFSPIQMFWTFFPSFAFMIWSIFLEVTGLSFYHKISKSRAFWGGVVLPWAVLFVAFFVVFFAVGLLFFLFGVALFPGMMGG